MVPPSAVLLEDACRAHSQAAEWKTENEAAENTHTKKTQIKKIKTKNKYRIEALFAADNTKPLQIPPLMGPFFQPNDFIHAHFKSIYYRLSFIFVSVCF